MRKTALFVHTTCNVMQKMTVRPLHNNRKTEVVDNVVVGCPREVYVVIAQDIIEKLLAHHGV